MSTNNKNNNIDRDLNTEINEQLYKLTIPPDLKESKSYQNSTKVGYVGSKTSKCPVSLMYTDNRKIPFCTSAEDLSFLGSGYPLFFQISKKLMIALLLLLPFAAYRCYINFKGEDCLSKGDLEKLDEYVNNMKTEENEKLRLLNIIPDIKINFRDPFTSNLFKSRQNLDNFMKYFCSFKWYTKDDECENFEKKDCYKYYTEECQAAALEKFKKVYEERVCYKSTINVLSEGNRAVLSNDAAKEESEIEELKFLRKIGEYIKIFVFFLLFLMIIHIQFYHEKMTRIHDSKNLTVEDFSVKLIGLPSGKGLEGVNNMIEIVKNKIEKSGRREKYNVTQVNFVYDTEEYMNVRKELHDVILEEQKFKFIDDDSEFGHVDDNNNNENMPLNVEGKYSDFGKAKEDKLRILSVYEKKYSEGAAELLTGKAFVSFGSIQEAERFLKERYDYNLFRLCCRIGDSRFYRGPLKFSLKGKNFKVYALDPEEPNDIIWENQSISWFTLTIRWVIGLLLSLLVLIFGFLIVLTMSVLFSQLAIMQSKRKDRDGMSEIWANIIDYGGAVTIFLFDFVLEWAIKKIAKFRKPKTFTQEHVIIFKILWVLQFLTNALIPVFYSTTMMNYFGEGGLVEMINGIYISNLWLNPLIRIFIDKDYLEKLWERRKVEKFVKTNKGKIYTQFEANEIFEDLQWQISAAHAFMLKSFAVGLFFTPLFPLSIPYTFFVMFIYYWIEKWILFNRCNKIYKFGSRISKVVVNYIPVCMLIFSLGFILEENVIRYVNLQGFKISILDTFLLGFSLAIFIIDFSYVVECFVGDYEEEGKDRRYSDMKFDNTSDYDLVNPATCGKAREREMGFVAEYWKLGMLKERGKVIGGDDEIGLAGKVGR